MGKIPLEFLGCIYSITALIIKYNVGGQVENVLSYLEWACTNDALGLVDMAREWCVI